MITFEIWGKKIQTLGKNFSSDCKKWLLRVHWNKLGFFEKCEHVHSELADSGEKNKLTEEKKFSGNLHYDGK